MAGSQPATTNGHLHNGDVKQNGHKSDHSEVTVVGAGPAGLMLASNLVRFGIETRVIEKDAQVTPTGKADGLQPKSMETFRQMRIADDVLRLGNKIYDISYWNSSPGQPLRRTQRQIHYPDFVGAEDPYIITVHQGIIENIFIQDMAKRNVHVSRPVGFSDYKIDDGTGAVQVTCDNHVSGTPETFMTDYLVGCDGSRSRVREAMPGNGYIGEMGHANWGVIDGVLDTDFPDLWHKVIIHTEEAGTALVIPRERGMTRIYLELNPHATARLDRQTLVMEWVQNKAKEIFKPFKLEWKSVEWFGTYIISQRVVKQFSDPDMKVFMAGDAAHTHSPKAAQGMNTSIHDGLNLAWKLNLVIRGLAKKDLLTTYTEERGKIAKDLVDFDRGHVKAYEAGPEALEQDFTNNIRFLSGIGVEYRDNILNQPGPMGVSRGLMKPGTLIKPATVTRYIDSNPVDIQLDIPWLCQFRVFFFVPDIKQGLKFLHEVCSQIDSQKHILATSATKAAASYEEKPRPATEDDMVILPDRYLAASQLVTYALVTTSAVADFEIADLPPTLQQSQWTCYVDNFKDQKGGSCTEKWFGKLRPTEAGIVNVRPDGYVGSLAQFDVTSPDEAGKASEWLEKYYSSFLA